MEVICLILGPMLASRPCLCGFWDLTSLHLLSLKMFFIILVSIAFFSKWCEYVVDCRNTGAS